MILKTKAIKTKYRFKEKLLRSVCWTASTLFYGNGRNGDWIYEKMHHPSTYINEASNILYYAGKRPKIHRPVSMIIEPVFGCNLNCSYCWHAIDNYFEYKSKRPHLMPMPLFSKVLDQAPGTIESIAFGLVGEPLLHPDIDTMIGDVHRKGFRSVLYTNGTLLSGNTLRQLSKSPLDVLSVSVEPDEYNSRKHRGVPLNTLRNAIECFAEHKSGSTEIKLSVVVHEDNYNKVTTLKRDWANLIKHIKLSPVIRYNGTTTPGRCIEPWRGSISILTDGTVTPCCVSAGYRCIPVGNLNQHTLDEILKGSDFRKLLSDFIDGNPPEICYRCNEFKEKKIPMRVPGIKR